MKNKFSKISFIYFLSMCLVGIVFILGYLGILQNDILSSFLIQIVVMFAVPMLLYSLIVSKNLKKTFSDFGFKKISSKIIIISILLGFCLFAINCFISNTFASIISMFGYENLPIFSASTATTPITYKLILKEFILSAVLPGFCEEFLHRGLMLNASKKYTNPRYCLIISSLLFGLVHLNIKQFFYAAIMGGFMGYVSLASESIYPAMIIHFMNNFLSNYAYYGSYLNWPFVKLFATIETFLLNNVFYFITLVPIFIFMLFGLYFYLVQLILKDRTKRKVENLIKSLNLENLPIQEVQKRVDEINLILNNKNLTQFNNIKPKFNDKIFIICSIVLGGLITISTFIWGII